MGGSRLTTWGPFHLKWKTSFLYCSPAYSPGFICNLQVWQIFLLDATCRAGGRPPWPGHCCWLCFWTCFFFFCCSGYIFVRPEHKEPLWFGAGSWAASKLSRLASTYWRFPLRSRTFCSTVELWERSERDFTLQPNHMVSSGERGGLDVREERLEG